MIGHLLFVTYSEVVIDPDQPIPDWPLSEGGGRGWPGSPRR